MKKTDFTSIFEKIDKDEWFELIRIIKNEEPQMI